MFRFNRFLKKKFIFLVFISTLFFFNETVPRSDSTINKEKHPIYSKYIFEKGDEKIHIGIQPLWLPANIITEVMKRDSLLKKSMKAMGKEIIFHPFLKGDDVNFFMKGSDIQAGVGGDMPTISLASSMDLIIPTIIQQGFVSIVSKRYDMIEDLSGKKIAYAYGSNAHFALLNALSLIGIKESDVKLIPFEVNQMTLALFENKIDAFSAWEPVIFQAITKYPEMRIIHQGLSSGFFYFNRKFYEKFPKAVEQIVAAQIRALYWIKKDHKNLLTASEWTLQAMRDFTGEENITSAEQLGDLAINDFINITEIPFVPFRDLGKNGSLKLEFEFLLNMGKIPHTSKWNKIKKNFDQSIIKKIVKNPDFFQIHNTEYKK